MTNTLKTIELWHRRARPEPTNANLRVQLGCHLEEVCEMFETFSCIGSIGNYAEHLLLDAHRTLYALAEALKTDDEIRVHVVDRKGMLDSLADQVVTGVGVGHCTGMNVPVACERVDVSNWTKLTDGKFTFDANGKIVKPSTYQPPDLSELY